MAPFSAFRHPWQPPDKFLRGAGVPETLITYLPSLIGKGIEYYSCFISYRLNLAIQSEPLGDNVAGMLVVEGDRGAIGYDSTHALVRQRFTIAHQISHYLLHVKKKEETEVTALY